jgi:hypothetical protein
VDGSGNAYVTGAFDGMVDFDPGSGADNHTSNGLNDIFLSKFDSSGNFDWARTWGASDDDQGSAVALDESGDEYVTGMFNGTVDFNPGSGVDSHTSNSWYDAFLSKFDSSGNFMWALTWGGSGDDSGFDIAVDGSGDVYVTGWFYDIADFDTGSGIDNHTSNGQGDILLSKFDSSGNFKWAQTWGGIGEDWGNGVAVDGSGDVYVTGGKIGIPPFDPGVSNMILKKFDSSGIVKWSHELGEAGGYGVAGDGSGNAYVTGCFDGTVDFDPSLGVDNHTSNGNVDVFLIKFMPDGWW